MVLEEILAENAETEYGRKYDFSTIRSVDEYRDRVPLTKYEDYEASIRRMIDGEEDILFNRDYRLLTFCFTSGTTGKGYKMLPVNFRQMERYGTGLDDFATDYYKKHGGKRLFQQTFRTQPGEPEDKLLISELLYKFKAEKGDLDYETFVAGKELLFDRQAEDSFFAHCFAALTETDITLMEACYLFDHLRFFTFLESHWESVIESIRQKNIPADIHLSRAMTDRLFSLPVTEERLKEAERELRAGFDGIAKRLWPRLGLLTGVSNIALMGEDELLGYYVGNIPRYHSCYMSTECYIGQCIEADSFLYEILSDNAFYEFLPEKERQGRTVLPHEVVPGNCYEPIITTFGGLYRYRMGDLLLAHEIEGGRTVFEVKRRRGLMFSVAGERMGILQLEEAIRSLQEDGIRISLYCFGSVIDRRGARYRVVLSGEGLRPGDRELADRLDQSLKDVNPAYASLREMHYLEQPELRVLDMDAYFEFLEENHVLAGNKKPVHMTAKGFSKW